MIPETTPALARALRLMHQFAALAQAPAVEPLHLLQALLAEEEGLAWACLERCGASPEGLRRLASPVASAPASPVALAPGNETHLPLADSLEQVLTDARQLAREMTADHIVSSEHVLLALLRQPGEPLRPLADHGLDLGQLERELLGDFAIPLRLEEPLELGDLTEQINLARILDASANRAREALRVLEDYCRFVLDDALLTEELKTLRHELTRALGSIPSDWLLAGRDTTGDVGTTVSTPAEQHRTSLLAVVQAGCKRLQEALRSLEEYGKVIGAELGQTLEQLRYRSYTLERALVPGAASRTRLADVRLYALVTGSHCYGALEWTIREAAAGGVQMFQLREKELSDRDLLERAHQLRRWTRQTGTLLIINDRPDIARLAEADGVHLGQDDLPVRAAREIVGPEALVGVSTHNLDQLRQAIFDGASYVGVGPTFPSTTKEFSDLAGLEYVRSALASTSLPAFAIGGITLANVDQVLAAGARRIAVSAALCSSDQPQALARALRQKLGG